MPMGTLKSDWEELYGGQGKPQEEWLGGALHVACVTFPPKYASNSTKFGRFVIRNKEYQEPLNTTNMEAKENLKRRD